jgi:hypothetical protein
MCGTLSAGSRGLDPHDLARDPAEAGGLVAVLAAEARHHLAADADAEEGRALADHPRLDRLEEAGRRHQPGAAIGEGADPRQHDPVGAASTASGSALTATGPAPTSAAMRAKLFSAECRLPLLVVDDDRADQGRSSSVPLVEGTAPPARGSGSTASRSARATALKAASTTWWLFSPSRRSTWSVMPGASRAR